MNQSARVRARIITLLVLVFSGILWTLATRSKTSGDATSAYAQLMAPTASASVFPGPLRVWHRAVQIFSHPLQDDGPNHKGIMIDLGFSLARVLAGFLLAMMVGIPLGFLIGMSPTMRAALNPFIQILRPISPLAWMPLALYTVKGADASSIFVIFICALWPMLLNTSHGVADVPEGLLNVARTLEVRRVRLAWHVILPACAPMIVNGMRVAMGIAWLVIVAAEMLVGGTGIGAFVWNSWNDLSLSSVLVAIVLIGLVGMVLDSLFARLARYVAYEV